jgi:hypothetical protein
MTSLNKLTVLQDTKTACPNWQRQKTRTVERMRMTMAAAMTTFYKIKQHRNNPHGSIKFISASIPRKTTLLPGAVKRRVKLSSRRKTAVNFVVFPSALMETASAPRPCNRSISRVAHVAR